MKINANLLESDADLYKIIKDAVKKEISRYVKSNLSSVHDEIQSLLIDAIKNSPEFISLAAYGVGDLAPEFGFVRGSSIQSLLLNEIPNHLSIDIDVNNISIKVSFDIPGLASSSIGSYISNSNDVEWLKWLLLSGTTPVISNFQIDYNLSAAEKRETRSHVAHMIPGGTWAVPSQFAGTIGDNFITRSIESDSVVSQIERIVTESLQ